jgi:hypothetical protein
MTYEKVKHMHNRPSVDDRFAAPPPRFNAQEIHNIDGYEADEESFSDDEHIDVEPDSRAPLPRTGPPRDPNTPLPPPAADGIYNGSRISFTVSTTWKRWLAASAALILISAALSVLALNIIPALGLLALAASPIAWFAVLAVAVFATAAVCYKAFKTYKKDMDAIKANTEEMHSSKPLPSPVYAGQQASHSPSPQEALSRASNLHRTAPSSEAGDQTIDLSLDDEENEEFNSDDFPEPNLPDPDEKGVQNAGVCEAAAEKNKSISFKTIKR